MTDNTPQAETQARRLETAFEQLVVLLNQPEFLPQLGKPPNEDEWSVMQILGHLVEMIPYWLSQCQVLMAANTGPPQFGRSSDAPERLAGVQRGATGDSAELQQLLQDVISSAANTIRGMSAAERQKTGIHVWRGEMSVADIIDLFIVAHVEDHLAQIRATLGKQT